MLIYPGHDPKLVSMELSEPLKDAIAAVVGRRYSDSSPTGKPKLDLVVDKTFEHDGLSGADLKRVCAIIRYNGNDTMTHFVAKRWDPSGWLTQLMGVDLPLESILYEGGHILDFDSKGRLRVPIVGSVRNENDAWNIMEDVSEELSAWKASAIDSAELPLQRELLDRMAEFHVRWEDRKRRRHLRVVKNQLVPQEMRLRWFERLFREWFGGAAADPRDSPALRKAKKKFTDGGRETWSAFLDRLPEIDRSIWCKHMQRRDMLVSAASNLPVTFLHGDLIWRNIGVRLATSGNTFVLIDWEIACLGNPAFDLYYFLSEPLRRVSDRVELAEHYYERYLFHGGCQLNKRQWQRGCDVAIVHFGLCWLPFFSERAMQSDDDTAIQIAEGIIERTKQALHDIAL